MGTVHPSLEVSPLQSTARAAINQASPRKSPAAIGYRSRNAGADRLHVG